MSNVIAVESLTKRYGELTAVNNLTFTVKQGLCFGLLGPNGAGKTTTIEMLEGIVKPTSGQIKLFGEPASKKLYSRVGIQFQNTSLQDYIKVRETLTLFSSFYEKSADIDELVELCALSDFIDQDVKKLSGGQRQRMLLALALVNDPDLIFLDEPTTGLDPHARRNFWDLIQAIKSRGKSIVLTTHYMDEAQTLCDEVAIMDKGIIIERGEPEVLLNRHFKGALIQLPKESVSGIELSFPVLEQKDRVEILTERVDQTLEILMQRKIPLEGMQIKNANLDDLFLKLTGHEMRN
jgi:ABC-2 type transport system ATP-binding protein